MTKLEKKTLGITLIVFLLMVAGNIMLVKTLKPVATQINNKGLKSVVNDIWNGKEK